jgi:hypothetical protein
MLPIPTRRIFRNRWWTLAWSIGIVWAAVQFADEGGDGGQGATALTGNEAVMLLGGRA